MNKKKSSIARPYQVSILTSFFLTIFKFFAGWSTHSMAIMASALDSFMDLWTSFINLIAAREASKPPDREHEYGHGKIESLAGLFQSMVILASGCYLIFESVKRLFTGSRVEGVSVGIIVMLISLAATFALERYLRAQAAKSTSIILSTERLHFSVDLLSGAGVIVALGLVQLTGFVFWDLLVSLLVACYVFRGAFGILRKSVDELLDRSLNPEDRREIEKIIYNHHPKIIEIHDFRSRTAGGQVFLDFHIVIKDEADFFNAHKITENLTKKLEKHLGYAGVTIHYDPEGCE